MEAGFRIFHAILNQISIFIPILIKATLLFLKPEWGTKNMSHFSLSVPKRSNSGHYMQLTIATTTATILEIVLMVQDIEICPPFWSLKLICNSNVALKTFINFFVKSSDDVTKKVNLH